MDDDIDYTPLTEDDVRKMNQVSWSGVLRGMGNRIADIASKVPHELAANYVDLGNMLSDAPQIKAMTTLGKLGARAAGVKPPREERATETSMTETPFATHTGDKASEAVSMLVDPTTWLGAGSAGVVRAGGRKLAAGAAEREAGKLADVLASKEAPMLAPASEGGAILPRAPGGAEAQRIAAEQTPIPRLTDLGREPKLNERSLALGRSKRAASAVDEVIAKGREINPDLEFWYGSEPLRQFALNEGLSQQEFERMLAQLSSASQRNPVTKENQLGSYLWGMERRGEFTPESQLFTNKRALDEGMRPTDPGVVSLPPGLGSISQSPIFYRAKDLALGKPPEEAFGPKMWSYYRNKLGNEVPVTVDVNAIHGPVMKGGLTDWLKTLSVNKDNEGRIVSRFTPMSDYEKGRLTLRQARERPGFWTDAPETPGEYKAFEDLWRGGANRAGVSPAGGQALGWYGSGDITALQTKPKTYMELLEQGARSAAARLGVTPVEAMRGAIQGKPGYQLGYTTKQFLGTLLGGSAGALAIAKALRKKPDQDQAASTPKAKAQVQAEAEAPPPPTEEQEELKRKAYEGQTTFDKMIDRAGG